MARPTTRAQLHARLVEALEAMPTTYHDVDLRHMESDAWHVAPDSFAAGVELQPMHRAHLSFALEWTRARRTPTAQKPGRDALAEVEVTVYLQFEYRPGHEREDYEACLDAADLVAHTLESGWHAGACNVEVGVDWDPRWLDGEPIIVTSVSAVLRHDRMV